MEREQNRCRRELIISPRMVAGKKESSGKFTGVMFGRDMIEVNGVMQTGLFGMKNGDLTFSIDAQTGDAFSVELSLFEKMLRIM